MSKSYCKDLSILPFSIGFPPIEDLRDLSGPDGITPVSDCLRSVLVLLVCGDFISLLKVFETPRGDRGFTGMFSFLW